MGNQTHQRDDRKTDMSLFIQKMVLSTTSGSISEPKIILPLKSLAFRGYKCLGMFLSPSDVENLVKLPYSNPLTKNKLPNGTEIHFCFCPEIPTTVIPVEIGSLLGEIDRLKVKETKCFLQKQGCEKKYQRLGEELHGYSASVKLDFVLMHAKDQARRFHLDGAIIVDLTHPLLSLPYPICLLGMDFMVKHPHFLFETRLDKRKELSFRLAKTLSRDRSYEVLVNNQNEVILDVQDHHNAKTGNIGCGIFFKTGSAFNSFCGVSRCDISGAELDYYWKERGMLVGILKALQIVETFSVESNLKPASVIIKTSSAEIEAILSDIKVSSTKTQAQRSREEGSLDGDRLLERGFSPAIRDVAMYYHENFVKRNPGFEIKYQHVYQRDNLDGTLSAKLLAIAGSEMEEFYIEPGHSVLGGGEFRGYPKKRWPSSRNAIPLISHPGTSDSSLYVSFGFDGYYHIQKERTHMVMNLADQAGSNSALMPHETIQVIPRKALEGKHVLSKEFNGQKIDPLSLIGPSEFENDWCTWTNDSGADCRPGNGPIQNKIIVKQPQDKADQNRSMKGKSSDGLRKEWIELIRKEYRKAKAQSKMGDKEAVDLSKVLQLWKVGPKMTKEGNEEAGLCHINCKCRTPEGACLCTGENGTIKCKCAPPLIPPKLGRPLHKFLGATKLTDNLISPEFIGKPGNTPKYSCCSKDRPEWVEEGCGTWGSDW